MLSSHRKFAKKISLLGGLLNRPDKGGETKAGLI